MLTRFFPFFIVLYISHMSFQKLGIQNHHHLQQNYYFYVFGSLQNVNNVSLSSIECILTFPDFNLTYEGETNFQGNFNISGLLSNMSVILVGEIEFIDPQGIYSEQSFEIILYLGNAFVFDLGNITLYTSTPNLTDVSVYGYIYSNEKPIKNASIFIQVERINESNSSIPQILYSNMSLADSVNTSSLNNSFFSSNESVSVITSDQSGYFKFLVSNILLQNEYDLKLIVTKQFYNDVQKEIRLFNMSEISVLINMSAIITQGSISGRILDQFQEPVLDIALTCNCSGGFQYFTEGLAISSSGEFSLTIEDIFMSRTKVVCNLTFVSKGFFKRDIRNLTLYRSKNYTKKLLNVTMNHETVKATVKGFVYNMLGNALNGVLLELSVENLEKNSTNSFGNALNLNGSTDLNGSFNINFTMVMYSRVNCTLKLSEYAYYGLIKYFLLDDLNNYAINFKKLSLKVQRVKAKIYGTLFDSVLNSSISKLLVCAESQTSNRTQCALSNSKGRFRFGFFVTKDLNYSYALFSNSEFFFASNITVLLNSTNNFSSNSSINLIRIRTELVIQGCSPSNHSNLTASFLTAQNHQIVFIENTTDSSGCFYIETPGFQGLTYLVELNLTTTGFYNFSSMLVLDSKNNYTFDVGNVSLQMTENDASVSGKCYIKDSNKTIDNVAISFYVMNNTMTNTGIFYRTKSEFDGSFLLTIKENGNERNCSGEIKMSKRGFQTINFTLDINFEEQREINLGSIYFSEI